MKDLGYVRSVRAGCPICSLTSRNKVGLDLHRKLKKNVIKVTHVIWKRQLQVMKPRSIIFNPILRLKIRFGIHLRATDLSLRAVAKYQIACYLTQLIDFYQKCRPCTGVRSIKLLHDNAPAHKSATVQEYLKDSGLDVLDHSPYSPDLSPCDFW